MTGLGILSCVLNVLVIPFLIFNLNMPCLLYTSDHYLTNASANQTQQTVLQLMEDTKELTKDVDLAMGVTARDEFSKKATVWGRHFLSYMQL